MRQKLLDILSMIGKLLLLTVIAIIITPFDVLSIIIRSLCAAIVYTFKKIQNFLSVIHSYKMAFVNIFTMILFELDESEWDEFDNDIINSSVNKIIMKPLLWADEVCKDCSEEKKTEE